MLFNISLAVVKVPNSHICQHAILKQIFKMNEGTCKFLHEHTCIDGLQTGGDQRNFKNF